MKYLKVWVLLVSVLVFVLGFEIYAKTIYILHFNDFHAMIHHSKPYKDVPGMVFFMDAILAEINKHGRDNVILVSGGDNYQGTVVSYGYKRCSGQRYA